jgi:hypothetical protein
VGQRDRSMGSSGPASGVGYWVKDCALFPSHANIFLLAGIIFVLGGQWTGRPASQQKGREGRSGDRGTSRQDCPSSDHSHLAHWAGSGFLGQQLRGDSKLGLHGVGMGGTIAGRGARGSWAHLGAESSWAWPVLVRPKGGTESRAQTRQPTRPRAHVYIEMSPIYEQYM